MKFQIYRISIRSSIRATSELSFWLRLLLKIIGRTAPLKYHVEFYLQTFEDDVLKVNMNVGLSHGMGYIFKVIEIQTKQRCVLAMHNPIMNYEIELIKQSKDGYYLYVPDESEGNWKRKKY